MKIAKYIKKFIMMFQICALLTVLTGLSSCKKSNDLENTNNEGILEQEGDLEIEIPEGEETFGE